MFKSISKKNFWILTGLALIAVFWVLRSVMTPFVLGAAIAYFLDPVVERLKKFLPRGLSTFLVLSTFISLGCIGILLILPTVERQFLALLHALPDYIAQIRKLVTPFISDFTQEFDLHSPDKVQQFANQYGGTASSSLSSILGQIIKSGAVMIHILILTVITPVVSFYLLRDWPLLVAGCHNLIPRHHYKTVRKIMTDVDRALAGYLRGQALLCLVLSFYYSIALSAIGLRYGLVVGLLIGLLSFIPFLGGVVAWASTGIITFLQFNDPFTIGIIVAVLVFGYILESYILAPRLIGERVGLHPVWILFAVLAGVASSGMLGAIVAIPLAAILGVLIRFAVGQYKISSLYKS